MKILWHSNAPWASTGYGQQTALLTPRIAKHHDIAISAFYGLEGAPLNWNGINVFPGQTGTYGNEVVTAHAAKHFGGDPADGIVLSLMDVWVLDANVWGKLKTVAWVPVDHQPPPPLVEKYLRESGTVPIAMSRFGQEELAEFDALYCPHAVDTEVFNPIPQDEARRRAGLPTDAFICGMVAANKGFPSRKSFPESLRAFKAFYDRHPDDARIFLHTELLAQQGMALPALMERLGIPEEAVFVTDQKRYVLDPLPPRQMAAAYSAFDVLLNPAAGEGFGVPVLESQACGTPAIVTDFSAMPEVCGAGWTVSHRPLWTGQLSWQASPDVEDIVEALEECYGLPKAGRKALSAKAVEHASQYEIGRVVKEHMLPAIEEAAERLEQVREEVAA